MEKLTTDRLRVAGASGDAVSFGCEEYVFSLSEIEDYIYQKLPTAPDTEELLASPKVPNFRRRPSGPRRRDGGRGRSGRGRGGGGGRRPGGRSGPPGKAKGD